MAKHGRLFEDREWETRFASEYHVCAQLLLAPEHVPVAELSADDFEDPKCSEIFRAICAVYEEQGAEATDALSVADHLKGKYGIDVYYLIDLTDSWVTGPTLARHHAKSIKRKAADRKIRKAAVEVSEAPEEGGELFGLARRTILDLERDEATQAGGAKQASSALEGEAQRAKAGKFPEMIRWGSPKLDDFWSMPREGVHVIGGRPGEGKTNLMRWLKLKLLAHSESILSVVTEASDIEDHRGTAALAARVNPNDWLVKYRLTPEEHARYLARLRELGAKPLWYLDRTTRLPAIVHEIERLRRVHGITSVLVDHIHDIHDPVTAKRGRREELDAIWAGLCRACQDGKDAKPVSLFAAAELTRPPKDKRSRRPTKDDIKGSGKAEEVAYVVSLIHDPWLHDKDQPADELLLIVDKHRSGPKGVLKFRYDRDNGHILGLKSDRIDVVSKGPKQETMPMRQHWTEDD